MGGPLEGSADSCGMGRGGPEGVGGEKLLGVVAGDHTLTEAGVRILHSETGADRGAMEEEEGVVAQRSPLHGGAGTQADQGEGV